MYLEGSGHEISQPTDSAFSLRAQAKSVELQPGYAVLTSTLKSIHVAQYCTGIFPTGSELGICISFASSLLFSVMQKAVTYKKIPLKRHDKESCRLRYNAA
jgi:hypothetical protein